MCNYVQKFSTKIVKENLSTFQRFVILRWTFIDWLVTANKYFLVYMRESKISNVGLLYFVALPRVIYNCLQTDGHISVLRSPDNGWYTYYPNDASYRALGSSPLPHVGVLFDPFPPSPLQSLFYHCLGQIRHSQ
jgi:hypothetical protein